MDKLSKQEHQTLHDASRLSAPFVYEVIRRDGEEELNRSSDSLIWSGIAGGVVISFSVFSMAAFRGAIVNSGV